MSESWLLTNWSLVRIQPPEPFYYKRPTRHLAGRLFFCWLHRVRHLTETTKRFDRKMKKSVNSSHSILMKEARRWYRRPTEGRDEATWPHYRQNKSLQQ